MASLPLLRPISIVFDENDLKQSSLETSIRSALDASCQSSMSALVDNAVLIDLSQCFWYDLGALLWLIMFMHRIKKQGCDIQLRLPNRSLSKKADDSWSFLLRWRFFHALAEFVDDPLKLLPASQVNFLSQPSRYGEATIKDEHGVVSVLHSSRLLEVHTFGGNWLGEESLADDPIGYFLQRFSDRTIMLALCRLCGWTEVDSYEFVRNTIGEGIKNSRLHSAGSLLSVAMRIDNKYLTIAIADNGRGIPSNLRDNFAQVAAQKSDSQLIRLFTESNFLLESYALLLSVGPGVSTRPGHAGMGLHYLKNTVLQNEGQLRIRSGTAQVDFADGKTESQDHLLESPGTLIRVRARLAK